MKANEKKVLETLTDALPKMSKAEKYYLLGYGEAVIALRSDSEDTTDKLENNTDKNKSNYSGSSIPMGT